MPGLAWEGLGTADRDMSLWQTDHGGACVPAAPTAFELSTHLLVRWAGFLVEVCPISFPHHRIPRPRFEKWSEKYEWWVKQRVAFGWWLSRLISWNASRLDRKLVLGGHLGPQTWSAISGSNISKFLYIITELFNWIWEGLPMGK